jgi:hypothetical protein
MLWGLPLCYSELAFSWPWADSTCSSSRAPSYCSLAITTYKTRGGHPCSLLREGVRVAGTLYGDCYTTFITMCEAFLDIEPIFALLKHFFTVWIIKCKKHNTQIIGARSGSRCDLVRAMKTSSCTFSRAPGAGMESGSLS